MFLPFSLQDGDDPNDIIKTLESTPVIIATGENITSIENYLIFVEKGLLYSTHSFYKALLLIFCYYYIFDIAYPSRIRNTMLFLENRFLELHSSTKLTASAIATITMIDKL